MKKVIATLMTLALLLGLFSATAFAADDIDLNGDAGFKKEWSASGGEYKYLGYVSIPANVTSDYKYFQFTYTGDISTLRFEFNEMPADQNAGPYWFASDQVMKFVSPDGSSIPTKADTPTTVVIDLAASGIADLGKYANGGLHVHYLSPDVNNASFTVTDARLMTSATSSPAAEAPATEAPSTEAPKTGSTSIPTVAALLVIVCAGAALVYSKKRA